MDHSPDGLWKAIFAAASPTPTIFEFQKNQLIMTCTESEIPKILDRVTVLAAITAEVHEKVFTKALAELRKRDRLGG